MNVDQNPENEMDPRAPNPQQFDRPSCIQESERPSRSLLVPGRRHLAENPGEQWWTRPRSSLSTLTNRATHSCKCNNVADPLKHAPPSVCYHAEFGSSMLKLVGMIREKLQNLGSIRRPLWTGPGWMLLSTHETRPNLFVVWKKLQASLRKSAWKTRPLRVPPFKVTQGNRSRHGSIG